MDDTACSQPGLSFLRRQTVSILTQSAIEPEFRKYLQLCAAQLDIFWPDRAAMENAGAKMNIDLGKLRGPELTGMLLDRFVYDVVSARDVQCLQGWRSLRG